jgi:hypothetical protein
MRLVREALDTLTLPDAVMGVTLRVESVTGNEGAQGDLFDRGFASAPMVEDAIIQLTDDQGDVVVEAMNSAHPLLEQRTTWKGRSGARLAPRAPRPSLTLQLLPSPKIVTVSTETRRDHDMPVRYLDGNEWHDIVEAAGPDRVSGGSWDAATGEYAREYFRCVREDGMMVWLYRGTQQQTTDWFLHGWWD